MVDLYFAVEKDTKVRFIHETRLPVHGVVGQITKGIEGATGRGFTFLRWYASW